MDPIHQFEIKNLFTIGTFGGHEIAFTNSAAYMALTVVAAGGFLFLSTIRRALVPGRWQASAEMLYEFVAKMLRENAGEHGMRFFPLVFSLFMFVLTANLIGMFPIALRFPAQGWEPLNWPCWFFSGGRFTASFLMD